MLEISRDGKRIYFTNGLYTPWDEQFYPDDIRGWMAKVDVGPDGMKLDSGFFLTTDGMRTHQVRLRRCILGLVLLRLKRARVSLGVALRGGARTLRYHFAHPCGIRLSKTAGRQRETRFCESSHSRLRTRNCVLRVSDSCDAAGPAESANHRG